MNVTPLLKIRPPNGIWEFVSERERELTQGDIVLFIRSGYGIGIICKISSDHLQWRDRLFAIIYVSKGHVQTAWA